MGVDKLKTTAGPAQDDFIVILNHIIFNHKFQYLDSAPLPYIRVWLFQMKWCHGEHVESQKSNNVDFKNKKW